MKYVILTYLLKLYFPIQYLPADQHNFHAGQHSNPPLLISIELFFGYDDDDDVMTGYLILL